MKYVERYSNRATEKLRFTFEEDSRTLKNLMGYFRNFLLERQEVKGIKPRLGGNVSKLTMNTRYFIHPVFIRLVNGMSNRKYCEK